MAIRGGTRTGAGRKPSDGARTNLTVRVSSETKERIKELRNRGHSIGKHVDKLVETLYKEKIGG